MHVHCHIEAGEASVSRFDDEAGVWISESDRPAAMSTSRPVFSVPAIAAKSPDSRLVAMAEDGERGWVVATRTERRQHQNGGWSTIAVTELWERATLTGGWTVRRPISIDIGGVELSTIDAIGELVVDGERVHSGMDGGVVMRLDGDAWVAVGNNLRDGHSPLVGMAVFAGVPWLANTCEVTRHPDPRTLEAVLPGDESCGLTAMWARAADDIWVAGQRELAVVHRGQHLTEGLLLGAVGRGRESYVNRALGDGDLAGRVRARMRACRERPLLG